MALPTSLAGLAERAGSEAVGFGVGTALGRALDPEAALLAQEAYALTPTLVIDPATVALLVRLGRLDEGVAQGEVAQSGFNAERLRHLIDATKVPPDVSSLLEMVRRGTLDPAAFKDGLVRSGLDERYVDQVTDLVRVHLSAADAAMARQQGFIDESKARAIAAVQGFDAEDADLMYELSGLPPGIGEAMDLLRRGKIDEARFAQIVREGHTKTKYTDDLLALRYQPLSASVAAEALIRQRISESEAVRIADANGIQRDDFLLWSNMLGRPIATGQALTLARRGEFTFDQFKEAVARSDVRTEYADDLWKLRRVIPPLFQIIRLLGSGSITPELATKYVLEQGYDKDLAQAIVEGGQKTKTKHTRDLSATMIDQLYESGLETREWAISALEALGYDPSESEWHLMLLDARRLLAALQANLNLIHRMYVGHKYDRDVAANNLDAMGVDPQVRNSLIETWTHERDANVIRLSNAQIGQALKHGIITTDDAVSRWIANGYPEADAQILAQIAGKAPTGASPTAP